jgi:hypothetical protein
MLVIDSLSNRFRTGRAKVCYPNNQQRVDHFAPKQNFPQSIEATKLMNYSRYDDVPQNLCFGYEFFHFPILKQRHTHQDSKLHRQFLLELSLLELASLSHPSRVQNQPD